MFDEETLQALQSYRNSRQQQPQVMGVKTPPKKKKSFLIDQISTLGGIGGGIAGSFVAPIAGTAAGAAGGSAIGEAIENALMGDSIAKNVVKEGLIGGVLGAGPLRLAKAGMGAAKGVGTAATGAGAKNLEEAVLKSSMQGKMKTTGNKLLGTQYDAIRSSTVNATNPSRTIDELANIGITKPVDAERIAHAVTGSDGILNKSVMAAIGEAGIVPTTGVKSTLRTAIGNSGLVDSHANSVTKMVDAQLNILRQNGATPQQVMKVIQNLEKRAANFEGKGGNYKMITPENAAQAEVLKAVRDELEKKMYTVAGGNKNLAKVLTPELRNQLIGLNPKSPQWQQFVDTQVMGAKDIGQLRSAQAPFVRVKKIIDEGAENSFTFGGRGAAHFSNGAGPMQRLGNKVVDTIQAPAARVAGNTLRGASNFATPSLTNPTAKGIAARVGIGGNIVNGAMSGSAQTQPQSLEDILSGGNVLGDQTGMEQQQPETTSPYSRENLLYDLQRDPQNAEKYISYYQTMEELFGGAGGVSPADMSQSSKNAMASSDNAINTVDQLTSLFNQAGGGSGRIGGTVKGLAASAGLDENARVYSNLANASVTQIAKALAGSGAGTVSDMDAKVIIAALPTLRDNPNEARAKFAALRQRLETAKNNTMLYGGGGGNSLEDALMQQQGGYY